MLACKRNTFLKHFHTSLPVHIACIQPNPSTSEISLVPLFLAFLSHNYFPLMLLPPHTFLYPFFYSFCLCFIILPLVSILIYFHAKHIHTQARTENLKHIFNILVLEKTRRIYFCQY